MFQDDQIFSVFMFAVSAYLFYMWWDDLRYFKKSGGKVRRGAFAGAAPVPAKYCLWGAVAAVGLLALHVWTEYSLGVVSEQTSFSHWAIFSWIAAAFVEELIFRGYLVVQNKGVLALGASMLFFRYCSHWRIHLYGTMKSLKEPRFSTEYGFGIFPHSL